MNNRNAILISSLCLSAAALALSVKPAGAAPEDKFVAGESVTIGDGTVMTWARVNGGGKVIWAGFTMSLSVMANPPVSGTGPAGAFVVLKYPEIVRASTYFDHAQVQFNLAGHAANPRFADPHRYAVPHFDFHFYGIPVSQVVMIPFLPPPSPLLASVPAERLPVGYAQPEFSLAQMGRHASPLTEFTATSLWELTMVSGFLPDASYMHFIEPMITREFLLRRETFTLPIPEPAVLGKTTRFPSEFVGHYDKELDAYHFIFKGFETVN